MLLDLSLLASLSPVPWVCLHAVPEGTPLHVSLLVSWSTHPLRVFPSLHLRPLEGRLFPMLVSSCGILSKGIHTAILYVFEMS